nr:DNA damage-regulated autophagy modulator protein 2-like [Lytechinus pictus]
MAAGLGLAGIYVRYKQVILYSDDYDSRQGRMLQINKIGLVLGIVACFGMSVVANFQVGNILPVHFSGAFLLFAPGAVYGFLQAWLSYKMYPRHASILICHIRLILSIIIAIFFTLCTIFTLIAQELTHKTGSILHWAPEDGGYPEHVVATVSEWVVAIAFLLYYFTFIREFQTITIKAELKHHLVYDALVDANSYPPVANYDNSFSGAL